MFSVGQELLGAKKPRWKKNKDLKSSSIRFDETISPQQIAWVDVDIKSIINQDNDSYLFIFFLLCSGSFPSLSVGTNRHLSCAVTPQVSVTTTRLSCHVIGSLTRTALLLRTTTLLSSTRPSSICSCLTLLTTSHRVYIYIFFFLLVLLSQSEFTLPLTFAVCILYLIILSPRILIFSRFNTCWKPVQCYQVLSCNTTRNPFKSSYVLPDCTHHSYAECIYQPTTTRAYCIGTSCAELCEEEHCCMN